MTPKPSKRLTRGVAIRKYCYECSGFNHAEVTRCELDDCPLWPFRKGKEAPNGLPDTNS